MALPPTWKIKRELLRVRSQMGNYSFPLFEWIMQKRYDSSFEKVTRLVDGKNAISKKLAIFFIFQPTSIPKSIFLTCEFLQTQGYAVLLVSSTPICESDLQMFQRLTWKILLRPNFGYDFGGYRDGLRVLENHSIEADTVLIMNDSMWLPLSEDCQMLRRMENSQRSLDGPVFESIEKRGKHAEYFQSYFMLVKSNALRSKAFKDYWKNYRVSSRKSIVLVRGEEGFSQALFKAGIGGGYPPTSAVLFDLLAAQESSFMLKTLEYTNHLHQASFLESQILIRTFSDTSEWRKKFLSHIIQLILAKQPMGVIPYACIKLLDISFLKKSSFPAEHVGMRFQYLRAVKNGDLPSPHPDILAEITASKMDGGFTTDASISASISAIKVS